MSERSEVAASSGSSDPNGGRVAWRVCAAIALLGGALRWLVATDDPWLDEVWTLALLPRLLAGSDVFFHLHDANNHPLNSLYLYWLGDVGERFWLLRLHSVLAGAVAVGLAGFAFVRRGLLAAVLAASLTAISVPLVHYGSEARGYSLMLAGTWVAFLCLRSALERFAWRPVIGFGLACAFAACANLYFVQAYSAFGLWTAWQLWHERASRARAAFELCALHAIPFAAFGFLFVVFYAPGLSGERLPTTWGHVVLWAGSLSLGGPKDGPWLGMAFLAAMALSALGVAALRRAGDSMWSFFALLMFVCPIGWLIVNERTGLLPRLFAAQILMVPALAGVALAAGLTAGGWRRVAAAAALAGLVLTNVAGDLELLRYGRGQYGAALRYAVENSPPGAVVTVGCSHELTGELLVPYYGRFIEDRSVRFVPKDAPGPPPLWVMVLSDSDALVKRDGHLYTREASYLASRFGFPWYVYRLVSGELTPERIERLRAGAG